MSVIITSKNGREPSFRNFFQIARDEKRIQKGGLPFCEACDKMVSLIMPTIKEIIKEEKISLEQRTVYIGHNNDARVCVLKALVKSFKNYDRLEEFQKDILLDTITDRIEGAYLGSCDKFWHRSHRSWQTCQNCLLQDFCTSPDKIILS